MFIRVLFYIGKCLFYQDIILIHIAFLLGGYTTSFKHNILQYFFYEKFSDAQL